MRSLMKSLMMAATIGFFSMSVSAMENRYVSEAVLQDTVVRDTVKKDLPEQPVLMAQAEITYTKIEIAEIPQHIKTAVVSKYAAYSIDEAYKGNDDNYKFILKNVDTKLVVYYDEDGGFIKEETVKAEQTVILI